MSFYNNILNSNNENLINNLKYIWFEELKNNNISNKIPILIINLFDNKN